MERESGRMPQLIARVLGNEGHLSNAQAADFLREVLGRSTPGRLQHLVQLHLSRECNRPALAAAAAQSALDEAEWNGNVVTALQDEPSITFHLGGPAKPRRKLTARQRSGAYVLASAHPLLPGLEPV
jgi:hypothetical protein